MRPIRYVFLSLVVVLLFIQPAEILAQSEPPKVKPHVVVIGVNGMEWDIIRPLLIRGELPNLAGLIKRGTYGKLRTLSSPNCPRVYTTLTTSTQPEENGITGFTVGGITASTNMLRQEPLWSILSKKGITVGMANVPATFPVMPVNGYMISGMLTRGKGCEDGVLCSPKLSEVQGGDAVYPKNLVPEIEAKIGDISLDCLRMPSKDALKGKETEVITEWLKAVQEVRGQQTKLFDYLLSQHPTDFTMLVQSCEDRVGHWLYPIQPHNVDYNPKINAVAVDAFADQYRSFDKVLAVILKHVDDNTYVFVISDHGIKPLREFEEDPHMHMDHGGTTPVIAKHDFADGDDVPGAFIVAGPGIKRDQRLMGFQASVYDVAPTVLHIYGVQAPKQMRGRVLTEIFENGAGGVSAVASKQE
jgi:predicted AlkP superfamily phosphohydrolase/phosphomutase